MAQIQQVWMDLCWELRGLDLGWRLASPTPAADRLCSFDEQLEVETYFNSKIGSFNSYWIGLRQTWAPAGSGAGAAGRCGERVMRLALAGVPHPGPADE
jgi:hypothetical protein